MKLVIKGKTFECKNALKSAGFHYVSHAKNWAKEVSTELAQQIKTDAISTLKSMGILKKGCQAILDNQIVWTSKDYAETPQRGNMYRDQDGLGWNNDAAGNHVASKVIPGSSPDDRI